jgi:hypothetical protein
MLPLLSPTSVSLGFLCPRRRRPASRPQKQKAAPSTETQKRPPVCQVSPRARHVFRYIARLLSKRWSTFSLISTSTIRPSLTSTVRRPNPCFFRRANISRSSCASRSLTPGARPVTELGLSNSHLPVLRCELARTRFRSGRSQRRLPTSASRLSCPLPPVPSGRRRPSRTPRSGRWSCRSAGRRTWW